MEKITIKVSRHQLNRIYEIEQQYYDKTKYFSHSSFDNNAYNDFLNHKGVLRLLYYNGNYFIGFIGENYVLKIHQIITDNAINYINLCIRKNKLKKLLNGR